MLNKYMELKDKTKNVLVERVRALDFDEATLLFEKVLAVSAEDALIVGLEALEKEEGKYVTALSDSINCLLWADGNYSMLPPLIEKMDKHKDLKKYYYDCICSLVLGCSQTRTPLEENQIDKETERLIALYRK